MTHASVFWINDRLTSIVNIEHVPAEDRYKEAVSRVRLSDGKYYPARIIAISDNMKELENAEDQFMSCLNETDEKSLPKNRKNRGQRHDKNSVHTAATEKQISFALGERPRLDNKLSAAKEKTASANKVLKKNQKEADREIELALLNAKTSLFSNSSDSSHNSKHVKQKDNQEAGVNTNKTAFDTKISKCHNTSKDPTQSRTTNKMIAVERKRTLSDSNHMTDANFENIEYGRNVEAEFHSARNKSSGKTDEEIDESDYGSCDLNKTKRRMNSMTDMCTSSVALKRHNNSSIKEFIWDLGAFLGMDLKSSIPRKTTGSKTDILSVLPVAENQKKVEITLGSGLWISKAAKSKILITCDNDPYKLSRQIVQELYGKDTLRNPDVTAMGQGAGGRGIGMENLQAIYKFVKRNTPWDCPPPTKNNKQRPKLTFTLFTREVNRKIISLRRTPKNLSDSEEETSRGVQNISASESVRNRGSKRSASQEFTATGNSPPCSTSKKICPLSTSTQRRSHTPVKTDTPQKTPTKTPENTRNNVWVVTPLKQNNANQTTEPHDAHTLSSHQDSSVQNLSENFNAIASTQQIYPPHSHQLNIDNPYQYNHALHSYPQQSMMTPYSYPMSQQYPVHSYNPPPQQHYHFNPANSSHPQQNPNNQ